MNLQSQYLEQLEEELRYLKPKEINEIIKHYRDKINVALDYGEAEEKIISELPSPHDVAHNIYESRGISYLEIQKKRYRQKEIAYAVGSAFAILVLFLLFVALAVYGVISTINMNSLIGKSFDFIQIIDIILTIVFVISYDVLILVIAIYLIDLFYILIGYLLINILKTSPKTYRTHYKFYDFTISGWFVKVTKVKKLPLIILGSASIILVITIIGSFIAKGYMYRTLLDAPLHSHVETYDQKMKTINIEATDAKVYLVVDEALQDIEIEYRYEFINTITSDYQETVLTIKKDSVTSFDIFRLLDEPTAVIYIKLPSMEYLKAINIDIDHEGIVSYQNISSVDFNSQINLYSGTILMENVEMTSLNIDTFKADVKIANTNEEKQRQWINNINIDISLGSLNVEGYRTNNFVINNASAEIVINQADLDNLNINNTAGSIVMNEIQGKEFILKSSSSVNRVYDLIYEEMELNIFSTCSFSMIRTCVKNSFTASVRSDSYLNISYMKSPIIDVKSNNGTIIFYDLGNNNEIAESDSEDLQSIKQRYNTYDNKPIALTIEVENGDTLIDSSVFDQVIFKQSGKQIEFTNTKLNKLNLEATSVKSIDLTEVYGEEVFFTLNNSPLRYYNNESTNRFMVKYQGVSQIYTNCEYQVEQ